MAGGLLLLPISVKVCVYMHALLVTYTQTHVHAKWRRGSASDRGDTLLATVRLGRSGRMEWNKGRFNKHGQK